METATTYLDWDDVVLEEEEEPGEGLAVGEEVGKVQDQLGPPSDHARLQVVRPARVDGFFGPYFSFIRIQGCALVMYTGFRPRTSHRFREFQ